MPYLDLLKREGNFKAQGNWYTAMEIDTSECVFGSSCGKIDNSGGAGEKIALNLTKFYSSGKCIFVSWYAKSVTGSPEGQMLYLGYNSSDVHTTVDKQVTYYPTTAWTRYGYKVNLASKSEVWWKIRFDVNTFGAAKDVIRHDGAMVIEISLDEFNTLTTQQLLDQYPYMQYKTDWAVDDHYNFEDLNRVESNCQEIADSISTYSTPPTLAGIDTSRDNTDLVFYDDLNRIENNILELKTSTATPLNWITPKTTWATLNKFDYIDANRLESNLQALNTMANNIILELNYCGEIICGQDFNLGG